MTDYLPAVTEEELHAYVDGELPAERRQAVAAWLAAHPEEAAQVAAWLAQAESIRARFGAIAEERVPERLNLDYLSRHARMGRRAWTTAAAAALIAFVLGSGTGWFAHGATTAAPAGIGSYTADALEAHKLYVVEVRHPVEVPGDQRTHMMKWLSKRVGETLQVPDLSAMNLKLVGGRLLPGPSGASAFYMYEGPSGERYTVYCGKASTRETALRFKSERQFAAVYWVDDNVAYVVSGPAERARLEKVARAVFDQVDKAAAKKS